MCAFDQFAWLTDHAWAADGLIVLAVGFMVTVRFRVKLGLRFKVRFPFAFVILHDQWIALCDWAIMQHDQLIAQNWSNVHNICISIK